MAISDAVQKERIDIQTAKDSRTAVELLVSGRTMKYWANIAAVLAVLAAFAGAVSAWNRVTFTLDDHGLRMSRVEGKVDKGAADSQYIRYQIDAHWGPRIDPSIVKPR